MRISFFRSAFALAALTAACGPSLGSGLPARSPLAEQWYSRAKQAYRAGDFEDAHDSVNHAIQAAPRDPELRALAARVALTRLEFTEALKMTEGLRLEGAAATDLHGIRGRAFWYSGDIDQAADELEAMLADPAVKDPWAKEIAQLARRGSGRHPFMMEGGIIAPVEMPRGIDRVPLYPAHVVPIELEGDPILALVATGVSEMTIDSNARKEPAWVNLRFGGRIEVKDVPALTQDLAPISRQLGVPIKALLGVNLLRHLHVTFDRRGDQFIVRKADPSPPPEGSRVPLWYLRGGGMTVHGLFTSTPNATETPLLVDSSRLLMLALQDETWKKAGVDPKTLAPLADAPNIRRGPVPTFKLGGFDLSKMPAMQGLELGEFTQTIDVDVGGVVGAELLAFFRVTFADEGRFVWIEPDPTIMGPVPAHPAGAPMTPDADSSAKPPPPPAPPPSAAPPARGGSPAAPAPSSAKP
jgi:hypothetical protein